MKKINNWCLEHTRLIKIIVFLICLIPFGMIVYGIIKNDLGANPIEYVSKFTGTWALNFLWITLAVTPLRKIVKLPFLLRLRRMLGNFSFFYAFLHFLIWFVLDQASSLSIAIEDIKSRPFILVGFLAFVLLIPLAVTSFNRAIRLLGKNWQRLHYLIYPIAILGLLHFYWIREGKNNFFEPNVYLLILIFLLGYRLINRFIYKKTINNA